MFEEDDGGEDEEKTGRARDGLKHTHPACDATIYMRPRLDGSMELIDERALILLPQNNRVHRQTTNTNSTPASNNRCRCKERRNALIAMAWIIGLICIFHGLLFLFPPRAASKTFKIEPDAARRHSQYPKPKQGHFMRLLNK